MSVASDEQAVDFMNDSPYGLTASIWTTDNARANELVELKGTHAAAYVC